MARGEIPYVVSDLAGNALVGNASIQVNIRGGGAATVFAAETGGTTVSNPLTSSTTGSIDGWLDEGSYNLIVSGVGITTYTQPIEVVRGDGVGRYAAGSIALAALASSLSQYLVPVGGIIMTGQSSAPTGFTLCNGAAISRTTFSGLFAVIGTTYGVGDGSTTFNVPDLRGRAAIGSGTGTATGATNHTLGSTPTTGVGGEETHVLSVGELPSHNHGGATGGGTTGGGTTGIDSPDHIHTPPVPGGFLVWDFVTTVAAIAGNQVPWPGFAGNSGGASARHTHSIPGLSVPALSISSQGSGTAHNTLGPITTVNYIIKT